MTKVFVAGSRHLSRLSADVKRPIDVIIEEGLTVFVGDANEQTKRFSDTWRTSISSMSSSTACRAIAATMSAIGQLVRSRLLQDPFAYYSTKDKVMVDDPDYALMLWDGESKGTLNSVINMVRQD